MMNTKMLGIIICVSFSNALIADEESEGFDERISTNEENIETNNERISTNEEYMELNRLNLMAIHANTNTNR
ncbi:MAG: hypothetical protein ABW168_06010, partial [Sedimenticola sp.]